MRLDIEHKWPTRPNKSRSRHIFLMKWHRTINSFAKVMELASKQAAGQKTSHQEHRMETTVISVTWVCDRQCHV